jgi:hypothetical protein
MTMAMMMDELTVEAISLWKHLLLKQRALRLTCREESFHFECQSIYSMSLFYHIIPQFARQCLHELSANSSPNSDTTDVYRSDKSI